MQDAGLLALVAAAQVTEVPLTIQQTDSSIPGLQPSALTANGASLSGLAAAGQKPLVAAAVAGKTAAKKGRGVRGGRRAPKKRIAGISPEHMLYWVSQADIAMQLRCEDNDLHPSLAVQLSAVPSEREEAVAMNDADAIVLAQAVSMPEATHKQVLGSGNDIRAGASCKVGKQHDKGQLARVQTRSKRKQCL